MHRVGEGGRKRVERQRKRENIEDGLCTAGFEEGGRVWILQKAFNSGETEILGLTHVELYDSLCCYKPLACGNWLSQL